MNLPIREASKTDWPKIWPIFHEVVERGDTYAYDRDTSFEKAEVLWMQMPERTYVYEQEGNILGSYYLKPNQAGGGKHVCNCGYMVSANARGKGIASALCDHSQRVAKEMGYLAMQFNFVVSSNTVAIKLWEKHGFDIVGRLPKAFEHPELGKVDALVMYKWLGQTD